MSKISTAFARGQAGCLCSPAWGFSQHKNQQRRFSQPEPPSPPQGPLTLEKGSEFPGGLKAGAVYRVQEGGSGGLQRGGEESSTLYFGATAEVAVSPCQEGVWATPQTLGEGSPAQPASPQPATKPFPVTMADISPILGTCRARRFRPSTVFPGGALGGSECGEEPEPTRDLSRPATARMGTSLSQGSLKLANKPRLTSTPKAESTHRAWDHSHSGRSQQAAHQAGPWVSGQERSHSGARLEKGYF